VVDISLSDISTIRTLSGVHQPDRGDVAIDGVAGQFTQSEGDTEAQTLGEELLEQTEILG
jgi:ABC-type sugar transport system ATPase subunit